MHPRVSHDDGCLKEKKERPSERIATCQEKEGSLQRRFRSVKWKFLPLHYYRTSLKYGSKIDWCRRSYRYWSWHIKISKKSCDLSCFRLRSSLCVILLIYYRYWTKIKKRSRSDFCKANLNRMKRLKILNKSAKNDILISIKRVTLNRHIYHI